MPQRLLAATLVTLLCFSLAQTASAQETSPVLHAIGNKTTTEGTLLTFTATASDPTGSALLFSLVGQPQVVPFGASIDPISGVFTWTPSEAQGPAIYLLTVRVTRASDGASDQETIQVTVVEANQAPVLAPIGSKTACPPPSPPLQFTATATDPDLPANNLTFSLTLGSPAATGASITSSGAFTWSPTVAQMFGVYPITICVTDNGSPPLQDCELFAVTVGQCFNSPPVLGAIGDKTIAEGNALTFIATATDADVPAQTLSFSLSLGSPPATGASISAAGAFSWTPTEAQGPNVYPITVIVTDDTSLSDSGTIQVTVTEVNLPPVVASIPNQIVAEGTTLTVTVSASDPDLPPNQLTCSLQPGAPVGAAMNPINCTFTFTPTECQGPGIYTATVCVADNGNPPLTTCVTFAITVQEVNEAPTLAFIGNKTVSEGQLLTFTATATDADCPSQALAFTLVGAPIGATIHPGTGVFTWTPTEDQGPGTFVFTVRVTDSGTLSDTETIQVTVLESDATPVADAGGPYVGVVGVGVSFDGTGSSDPDGGPLTFLWDFGDGNGSTTVSPVHIYTAEGDYAVSLQVTDLAGLSGVDLTTVSIVPFFTTEVFFTGGNKTTRLASGKGTTCVQLEPVNTAYNNSDVELESIRMVYGSSSIPAISDKTAIDSDADHDGIAEIGVCFSKENLRVLFAGLPAGENQVDVTIEGSLVTGGSFQGTATHRVFGSGSALQASVSPNPLNPEATAVFRTSKTGSVTVQLFDLNGRLIRTLLDERSSPAGYHEVKIAGRDGEGRPLASGVYYLRISTLTDGTETKAITILK